MHLNEMTIVPRVNCKKTRRRPTVTKRRETKENWKRNVERAIRVVILKIYRHIR